MDIIQVIPQMNRNAISDVLRPKCCIEIHAIVYPGISIKQTNPKFIYLFPLILVEFNDSP